MQESGDCLHDTAMGYRGWNDPAAEPVTLAHVTDVDSLNTAILADATPQVIALDMYTLLADDGYPDGLGEDQIYSYSPEYTDDGIDPNTAGGRVMTQALQAALASENTTQAKRSSTPEQYAKLRRPGWEGVFFRPRPDMRPHSY